MAIGKLLKIAKWITNPLGSVINAVVENNVSNETVKDVVQLATMGLGTSPVVETIDFAEKYSNGAVDTRLESEKKQDAGILKEKEYIEGFDLNKFKQMTKMENGEQVSLRVVENSDGSVFYPVVHSLMGMHCENVLVDGWGKYPKIIDIGVVGDELEYYTKENSTYAIPYVIAVWNKISDSFGEVGDKSMLLDSLENLFSYFDSIGAKPRLWNMPGTPVIYVNPRFVSRVDGSVSYPNKNTQTPPPNYDFLFDYTIVDGVIQKDNTEPEQMGFTDMLYLKNVV